jgi:hypothetical protein
VRLVTDSFDLDSVLREVAEWDLGHAVRSLDVECNGRAARWGYVSEYRQWFELFVSQARLVFQQSQVDPLRNTLPFAVKLPYNFQPARFVRQVCGMFLAVQETRTLLDTYPKLSQLIASHVADASMRRTEGLDIAPLHIYMSVCHARWSYLNQPMSANSITLNLDGRPLFDSLAMNDVLMLSLSPFVFVLTTLKTDNLGLEITDWTQWSVAQRPSKNQRDLSISTADQLPSTFRAMIYPDDYVAR